MRSSASILLRSLLAVLVVVGSASPGLADGLLSRIEEEFRAIKLTSDDVAEATKRAAERLDQVAHELQDAGFQVESVQLEIGEPGKAVLHLTDAGKTGHEDEVLSRNADNHLVRGIIAALIRSRDLHVAGQAVSGFEITLGLVPGLKIEFAPPKSNIAATNSGTASTAAANADASSGMTQEGVIKAATDFVSSQYNSRMINPAVTLGADGSIVVVGVGAAFNYGDAASLRLHVAKVLGEPTVIKCEYKRGNEPWKKLIPLD